MKDNARSALIAAALAKLSPSVRAEVEAVGAVRLGEVVEQIVQNWATAPDDLGEVTPEELAWELNVCELGDD